MAAGIDHPMPGNVAVVRERVECVPDLPGVTGDAGETGHLAVGGHSAPRYAADDPVDPGIARVAYGASVGRRLRRQPAMSPSR